MQHSVDRFVRHSHPSRHGRQPRGQERHHQYVFVLPVVRGEMKCVAQTIASVVVSTPERESRVEQGVPDAFVNVVK
jgi:hypothetical protein